MVRVLFVLSLLFVGPHHQHQGKSAGAVSGSVLDGATGEAISNAIVDIRSEALTLRRSILADSKGRFVFYPLPDATDYELLAQQTGYGPGGFGRSKVAPVTTEQLTAISLAPDQWIRDLEIRLWRLGAISGRVIDESGEPLVGVPVVSFLEAFVAGHRRVVAGRRATTDDRGMYRIDGLDPGHYVIGVLSVQSTVPEATSVTADRPMGELDPGVPSPARSGTPSARSVAFDKHRLALTIFPTPPPASADEAWSYPPVFYSQAHQLRNAVPLDLDYGEELKGIDVHLEPVAGHSISGRVLGGQSQPRFLRLMPRGSEELGFGFEVATTVTEPSGAFRFLNVPSGEYTLIGQPSVMEFTAPRQGARIPTPPGLPQAQLALGSYVGTPPFAAHLGQSTDGWFREPVTVGSRIVDMIVRPRSLVRVRGRVEFSGDAAQLKTSGTPQVRVFAEPANGDPSLGNPSVRSGADGRFELEGLLAGRYLIRVFLGYEVTSVAWQGRDVTDGGIDASSGSEIDGVVVSITNVLGAISGTVAGRDQSGSASVVVFPVESSRWTDFGWNPSRIRVASVDKQGSYRVSRLLPGQYFVLAIDGQIASRWTDRSFLAAASRVAVKASLGPGENRNQDLLFVPWEGR
jgi:hypothetical protein